MTADFWTALVIDKKISRQDLSDQMMDVAVALRAKGCTYSRTTRINGEAEDRVWTEGWITTPADPPPFDGAALPHERRI